MSRSSTAAAPDPSAIDASLHLLVHQLADDLAAGALAPALLHVALEPDGLQLGLRELDGRHPSELLLGFVAPEGWYAVGSAAAGHAYGVADRATLAPTRCRVQTVTLLSRSGELAHRTIVENDPELTEQLAGEEVEGEQTDLLRLALELPTSPPPCSTAVYWGIQWLAGLQTAAPPASWDDVARAHPALALLSADVVYGPDDLVDAAASFARVCTWRRLRELVVTGAFAVPGLDGSDARWLDDGAFSRWVLTRCAPLSSLRDDVLAQLPDDLGRRLVATLAELGVPDQAWPERPDD
jgi:hypothetical protein